MTQRRYNADGSTSFKVPPSQCLYCLVTDDGATGAVPGQLQVPPKDGDIAFCGNCKKFSAFVDGHKVRRLLTADELGYVKSLYTRRP